LQNAEKAMHSFCLTLSFIKGYINVPRMGSGAVMRPDLFVDFGSIKLFVCLFTFVSCIVSMTP